MSLGDDNSFPLKRYILISLIAHLSLVVFFYAAPFLFAWKHKEYKIVWVELPPGIGNDVEAIKKAENLPRSSIQDQKESLEKPDAKEAEKPKDTAKQAEEEKKEPLPPKPEETPKPEEPIKIKESEEEKKEPEIPKQPEKPPESKPPTKVPEKKPATKPVSKLDQQIAEALQKNKQASEKTKTPIEAAQIPDEGKGAGSQSTLKDARMQDPVFAEYYALIRARINKEWITAPKLFDQSEPLHAQLLVIIDKEGTVTSTEFQESSGNYSFDLSAKRAVEHASPLPAPPAQLQDEVTSEGFLIEFSPSKVERE